MARKPRPSRRGYEKIPGVDSTGCWVTKAGVGHWTSKDGKPLKLHQKIEAGATHDEDLTGVWGNGKMREIKAIKTISDNGKFATKVLNDNLSALQEVLLMSPTAQRAFASKVARRNTSKLATDYSNKVEGTDEEFKALSSEEQVVVENIAGRLKLSRFASKYNNKDEGTDEKFKAMS